MIFFLILVTVNRKKILNFNNIVPRLFIVAGRCMKARATIPAGAAIQL
jgi:hypothetical protein